MQVEPLRETKEVGAPTFAHRRKVPEREVSSRVVDPFRPNLSHKPPAANKYRQDNSDIEALLAPNYGKPVLKKAGDQDRLKGKPGAVRAEGPPKRTGEGFAQTVQRKVTGPANTLPSLEKSLPKNNLTQKPAGTSFANQKSPFNKIA